MIWTELKSTIDKNNTFCISSHINPDGDSIGSQLAMYWYIKSIGKKVSIYNIDPVPVKLRFLTNSESISTSPPEYDPDVYIILDASHLSRLKWDGFKKNNSIIINIDHHRDNTRFGDLNVVEENAAAVGELIYRFFEKNGITYPEHVAETLYTSILTDTGCFRFSNTNGNILHICSDLAERGANCSEIYKKIYTSYSTQGLILQSKIWSSLNFYFNERVCTMEMDMSLIEKLNANRSDAEGMADNTILSKKIEVGIFMKHNSSLTYFNLRSNGRVDVGEIARMVESGGGHRFAAGCTIHLPVEKAKIKMLELIRDRLD